MASEFKQCPNGHYYQGISCPYCKTDDGKRGDKTGTKVDNIDEIGGLGKTTDPPAGPSTEYIIHDSPRVGHGKSTPNKGPGTIFGNDDDDSPAQDVTMGPGKEARYSRKLVGWLVTYSFDSLGVDYKLFEGRNVIGRDIDCNITVNDGRMSGRHAVILFRANKYSITDTQSSHGTFVNEEDIELEPRYLRDGDIIRMGSTVFKFRTSL